MAEATEILLVTNCCSFPVIIGSSKAFPTARLKKILPYRIKIILLQTFWFQAKLALSESIKNKNG